MFVALFLAVFALAPASAANTFWQNALFQGTSCSNPVTVQSSVPLSTCTTSGGCVSSGGFSGSVSCSPYTGGSVPPILLSGQYAAFLAYTSGNCAAGTEESLVAVSTGACIAFQSASFRGTCTTSGSSSTLTLSQWPTSSTCAGNPTNSISNAVTSQCLGNSTGGFGLGVQFFCGSTGATCFHENTQITYKGQKYSRKTLGDLKGECVIPHDVTSSGVAIHTDCATKPLQLTPDHLVYTTRGLIQASEVVVGDQVYSNLERTQKCAVKAVTHETGSYFGLNCKDSVVLADGIATSTFGRYHKIPSVWMHYASALIGVERASAVGDVIAQTLHRVGLL